MEDLTGKKFGKLLVKKRIENKVYPNGKTVIQWLCQCDCGKTCTAITGSLKNGSKKSCGCLHNKLELKGQRSGKLVALERLDKKKHNCYLWDCQCDCGNKVEVRSDLFKSGEVKSCGCLKPEMDKSNFKDFFKYDTNIALLTGEAKSRKDNALGFTGVIYGDRRSKYKYVAKIKFQKKQYYLGSALTPEEAHGMYKEAHEQLTKQFLNAHEDVQCVVEELKEKWKSKKHE